MCKIIGKSNERILCKLNKSEILRLYSIVRVAMETTKTSNFTCQSESFISIFFTCQVLACELQPSSCHDLANDKRSQTAETVFSHLNTHKPTEARTYSVMPLDSLNLTILDKVLSRHIKALMVICITYSFWTFPEHFLRRIFTYKSTKANFKSRLRT